MSQNIRIVKLNASQLNDNGTLVFFALTIVESVSDLVSYKLQTLLIDPKLSSRLFIEQWVLSIRVLIIFVLVNFEWPQNRHHWLLQRVHQNELTDRAHELFHLAIIGHTLLVTQSFAFSTLEHGFWVGVHPVWLLTYALHLLNALSGLRIEERGELFLPGQFYVLEAYVKQVGILQTRQFLQSLLTHLTYLFIKQITRWFLYCHWFVLLHDWDTSSWLLNLHLLNMTTRSSHLLSTMMMTLVLLHEHMILLLLIHYGCSYRLLMHHLLIRVYIISIWLLWCNLLHHILRLLLVKMSLLLLLAVLLCNCMLL